jgi:hypothetical protein
MLKGGISVLRVGLLSCMWDAKWRRMMAGVQVPVFACSFLLSRAGTVSVCDGCGGCQFLDLVQQMATPQAQTAPTVGPVRKTKFVTDQIDIVKGETKKVVDAFRDVKLEDGFPGW